MYQKIILASQSPRRQQLLEMAQVPFEIILPDIEETYPENLPPEQVPVFLSGQKAKAVRQNPQLVSKQWQQIPIVAADTVVELHNKVLGKPTDTAEAVQMLTALSGQEHQVITGITILKQAETIQLSAVTRVTFNKLTVEQINWYIENYRPFDKAGAYAIQEWIGLVGIRKIDGDYYNVVGLPVNLLLQHLDYSFPPENILPDC